MSWGTDFKADIFILNQQYQTKEQVEECIEILQDSIDEIEIKLCMYSVCKVSDVVPLDEDAITFMSSKMHEYVMELQSYALDQYKLRLLLENWETKVDS